MADRHAETGLANVELNRALAWLKARRRKLLGARLALGAYYSREPENGGPQDPLTDGELGWSGYSRGVIRELLIPMTDNLALYQCRQRCRQLLKAIAAHIDLGHQDQAEACEREFQAIRKYLSEVVAPDGRIKSFVTARVKNYQSNLQAWYYLLDKAEQDDPAVGEFLRSHILPGDPYLWVGSPLSG